MKLKKGFTLAEVLITLTIIGVVAVLTLPALLANTQEQQARTALKKMTNTFTQIASMNAAVAGFDYSGINVASNTSKPGDTNGSLLTLFVERCSVDHGKGYLPPKVNGTQTSPLSCDTAVYLKDGTAVYFKKDELATDATSAGKAGYIDGDGAMHGLHVIFDTNGTKGPNLISSCKGSATTVSAFSTDDDGDCAVKSNRFIKDQFMFRLRGNFVAPNGSASVWMMDEDTKKAGEFDKDSTKQTDLVSSGK